MTELSKEIALLNRAMQALYLECPSSVVDSVKVIVADAIAHTRTTALSEGHALGVEAAGKWRPISTAPRDGAWIDVWCEQTAQRPAAPAGRVPNVRWHNGDPARAFDNAGWVYSPDRNNLGTVWILDGNVTCWRPVPDKPDAAAIRAIKMGEEPHQ